ncbi:MAG: hypothetical protein O2984_00770 [Bacteroidetes bacterium]|nr:hypothetical protein [Bacteroidota bacterium]
MLLTKDDDILDLPEGNEDNSFWKRFVLVMRRLSVLLVLSALVFYFQHWPYVNQIFLISIIVWFSWNTMYIFLLLKGVFGKEGVFSELSYSSGRLVLLAAVLVMPLGGNYRIAMVFFSVAAIAFVAGVLSSRRWF